MAEYPDFNSVSNLMNVEGNFLSVLQYSISDSRIGYYNSISTKGNFVHNSKYFRNYQYSNKALSLKWSGICDLGGKPFLIGGAVLSGVEFYRAKTSNQIVGSIYGFSANVLGSYGGAPGFLGSLFMLAVNRFNENYIKPEYSKTGFGNFASPDKTLLPTTVTDLRKVAP